MWEPYQVKAQTLKTAVESATLLLRIDDIVRWARGLSGGSVQRCVVVGVGGRAGFGGRFQGVCGCACVGGRARFGGRCKGACVGHVGFGGRCNVCMSGECV